MEQKQGYMQIGIRLLFETSSLFLLEVWTFTHINYEAN